MIMCHISLFLLRTVIALLHFIVRLHFVFKCLDRRVVVFVKMLLIETHWTGWWFVQRFKFHCIAQVLFLGYHDVVIASNCGSLSVRWLSCALLSSRRFTWSSKTSYFGPIFWVYYAVWIGLSWILDYLNWGVNCRQAVHTSCL